ncbi:50S ribosomal protein L11 methyltransferase [Microvirga flavescens]|uniref:50S ribosomal protein L11 methyltransferase n=1 Tax=Microvirga flavescens TaxID=2249811 RepID=UPI000DD78841|nr:50S ribosomal protein L11 methyltransferase [Microvirga flavescens]
MSLDRAVLSVAEQIFSSQLNERQKLEQLLRAVAKWRAQLIGHTLVAKDGTTVRGGPFAGLKYLPGASEGGLAPKLLGVYEAALQPFFAEAPAQNYDTVLNVGCAEGFYAVGSARLLPQAQVLAWDIDPRARKLCAELALLNDVEARISLREEFKAEAVDEVASELSASLGRRPSGLLIMDCEGAEFALLDSNVADFGWLDIVVEVHPGPGRSAADLIERFRATHEIEEKQAQTVVPELPDWLNGLGHLDQLLAVWEWRAIPTPWLIMRRK